MDPPASDHSHAELVQSLLDRARKGLDPQRIVHVLGVTHTVMALAALHQIDLTDAALAGLLHDQSKSLPYEQIRDELRQMGYELPAEDMDFPHVWHGLHAAAYARHHLGLERPEVFEAVNLHTTADAGVGPLTKALFIADLCEPNRKFKEGAEILKVARLDLDEGFRQAMMHKLRHVLNKKKSKLHPRAVRALQAYANLEPHHLAGHEDGKK